MNKTMMIDFYEFTMAQTYFDKNEQNKKVYFDESIVNLGSGQSSQTAPLFLFRRSNADTGYAKIKLFNFKYTRIQHDNDFDLIPVERISDGVIGLLDLLSGIFYTNAGSGTFIKGDYIKVEHIYKMPLITKDGEEVVKVDYIESTDRNHFYINTGYVPNQNSKIIYDFEVTNWGGASSGSYTNQYGALVKEQKTIILIVGLFAGMQETTL